MLAEAVGSGVGLDGQCLRERVRLGALRVALALVVTALASLTLVSAATADGSKTIEGAPSLVLERTEASSWEDQPVNGTNGGEFWKVKLSAGEKLTIATSNVSGETVCIAFDVYAPNVTDGTLAGASPVATGSSTLGFVAPASGTWILFVTGGCGFEGTGKVSYEYDATVTPSEGEAANGAATIADAPSLILGKAVSSGWWDQPVDGTQGGEFWKVALTNGERLTLATSDVAGDTVCAEMKVFAPNVTDADLAAASPAASAATTLSFVAPSSGTWTVLVTGACGFEGTEAVSYDYKATITPSEGEAANGGATIASAPSLVLGHKVSSGWTDQPVDGTQGGEFWKVTMSSGQKLTLATSDVAGDTVCIEMKAFAPSVTDATLVAATPAASAAGTLSFVAPSSGTWILFMTGACGFEGTGAVAYDYDATVEGGTVPAPPAPSLTVRRQSATVSETGVLHLVIVCDVGPCSGTLRLTTPTTVRARGHRKAKIVAALLASGKFSNLAAGDHSITLVIDSTGLRLLRQGGHRLTCALRASFASGTTTKTASATVSLARARPREHVA